MSRDPSNGPGDEALSISVERRAAEELFALLGNEVRLEVLRLLGEEPTRALSFSELFDRVTMSDSGNFNYHLDRLVGSFVQKSAGENGSTAYELSHAGRQVVGAIHAGTYTAEATVEPFSAGWDCGLCGGDFQISYGNEHIQFKCRGCSEGATFPFPPGSLEEYSRAELPEAFARWWHRWVTGVIDGFYPDCTGRLHGKMLNLPEGLPDVDEPSPAHAGFDCERCSRRVTLSGSTVATMHPVVEGFLAEHGFDVTKRHASQVWVELDEWDVTIRSADPIHLTYTFGHAGEAVEVDIDPDAAVTNPRRVSLTG